MMIASDLSGAVLFLRDSMDREIALLIKRRKSNIILASLKTGEPQKCRWSILTVNFNWNDIFLSIPRAIGSESTIDSITSEIILNFRDSRGHISQF
jgi:hypothetical protein